MRAVVTGGLGFIGSHLVERLLADGHRVTVVDDGRTAVAGDVPGADIRRWAMEHAPFPPDADIVYHLAGPVGPVGVLRHAGAIVTDVVAMADTARAWALMNGCPLVYVSTSEVYGLQRQPMDESAPRIVAAGHSARMEYAVAKLAAETMLLNSPGLDVRVVRPFNVAGPRQQEQGGFVLPRFVRQAKAGEPLTVYTPGTQRRAFTHVLDIVDGIVRVGEQGRPGSVWNLGSPANECSIAELALEVVATLGSRSRIEVVDPTELWGPAFREAPDKVPDITRARTLLGWEPARDRRQVILDAAA